jgi:hypothetical protein
LTLTWCEYNTYISYIVEEIKEVFEDTPSSKGEQVVQCLW